MSGTVSRQLYNDFKRILKITIKISIALIIIAVIAFSIYWAYLSFQEKSREKDVLNNAIPFTKNHKPWIYTRTDFKTESKLELWFVGDTDQHAIIKINGKYSVFSTTTDTHGSINFHGKSGNACNYASAYLSDGTIAGVQCNNKSYSGGPWNKFR